MDTDDARKRLHPAESGLDENYQEIATLSIQQGCYRQIMRINRLSIQRPGYRREWAKGLPQLTGNLKT